MAAVLLCRYGLGLGNLMRGQSEMCCTDSCRPVNHPKIQWLKTAITSSCSCYAWVLWVRTLGRACLGGCLCSSVLGASAEWMEAGGGGLAGPGHLDVGLLALAVDADCWLETQLGCFSDTSMWPLHWSVHGRTWASSQHGSWVLRVSPWRVRDLALRS